LEISQAAGILGEKVFEPALKINQIQHHIEKKATLPGKWPRRE